MRMKRITDGRLCTVAAAVQARRCRWRVMVVGGGRSAGGTREP